MGRFIKPAPSCSPARPLCDFTDSAYRRGWMDGTDEKHNTPPRRPHMSEDTAQSDFFQTYNFGHCATVCLRKNIFSSEKLEQFTLLHVLMRYLYNDVTPLIYSFVIRFFFTLFIHLIVCFFLCLCIKWRLRERVHYRLYKFGQVQQNIFIRTC